MINAMSDIEKARSEHILLKELSKMEKNLDNKTKEQFKEQIQSFRQKIKSDRQKQYKYHKKLEYLYQELYRDLNAFSYNHEGERV